MRSEGKKAKHEAFKAKAKKQQPDIVFLGDSITAGWKQNGKIWEEAFGQWNPFNMGIPGDGVQHLLWRVEHGALEGLDPELVVILIGTNNLHVKYEEEEISDGVARIVQLVNQQVPDAKILVHTIFPRGHQPDSFPRKRIQGFNKGIRDLDTYAPVTVLDIGHIFLDEGDRIPKHISRDGTHLQEEGYRRWAEALKPEVEKLIGK